MLIFITERHEEPPSTKKDEGNIFADQGRVHLGYIEVICIHLDIYSTFSKPSRMQIHLSRAGRASETENQWRTAAAFTWYNYHFCAQYITYSYVGSLFSVKLTG